MNGAWRGVRRAVGAFLLCVAACGPATTGVVEPPSPPARGATELGPGEETGTTAEEVVSQDVGPLPGPPGADPPGFEPFEPLPEGAGLARVSWKIEGPLDVGALREGTNAAVVEVGRCLAPAAPGGRLPLHLILDESGRVVEVGGPLAEAGMREAITCAQDALRMLRFPAAAGETTLRLIVER